jgi:tRNA G18 (ribose-2'-O)-methylase SpoU
LGDLTGSRPH